MRLGAFRDPPDAPKDGHDDPTGAYVNTKGLAKGIQASHADLMVP